MMLGVNQPNGRGGNTVKKFIVELSEYSDINAESTRSPALWKSDLIILIIEHLQLYALILSLSLRWPWPTDYIRQSRFLFIVNFDLWELTKTDDDIYRGVDGATSDPADVPLDYFAYSLSWLLVAVCIPIGCTIVYFSVEKIKSIKVQTIVKLQSYSLQAFLIFAQLLCLPFTMVTVRLLQCHTYTTPGQGSEYRSVVLKDTICWDDMQIGLLVPMATVSIFYMIIVPLWMLRMIRRQLVVSSLCCVCQGHRTHEKYLRLKEMEYSLNLEDTWLTKNFRLFSSYRRSWVLYRPTSILIKAVIVFIYGVLFYSMRIQAVLLFTVLSLWLLLVLMLPVYRLHVFNVLLIISLLANTSNSVLGLLVAIETESSLIIGQNLINALLVIQFGWLAIVILCTTYLLLRYYHKIGPLVFFSTRTRYAPLWPVLPSSSHDHKYLQAILQSRRILDYTHSIPSILAPSHHLANQIQVINAYCREAELLNDTLHSTLWGTLDELIDVHNITRNCSIFANSTKINVQKTANELVQLLPSLQFRLEQREHDLILVPAVKRRLLLKLFVLSTFLYGRLAQGKSSCNLSIGRLPWQPADHYTAGSRRPSAVVTLATRNSSRPSTAGDTCDELIEQIDKQFPLVTVA